MIRRATHDDFVQWIELCQKFHAKTPFAGVEPDIPGCSKLFRQCLASKLGCVFVADRGGRLSGTLLGVAQEWWWCRKRVASDLIFFAERPGDGIAMLRAFVDWAWSVPSVIDIMPGTSSGIDIDRTDQLYERVGFRRIGSLFYMRRPT